MKDKQNGMSIKNRVIHAESSIAYWEGRVNEIQNQLDYAKDQLQDKLDSFNYWNRKLVKLQKVKSVK